MIPASPVREVKAASRTCKILIMAALPQEVRPFLRRIKARPRTGLGVVAWEWESEAALVALSGMGAAGVHRAGETLVNRWRPELLVSLGFAGALAPGLATGDVVVGGGFWHYDPDTRQLRPGSRPAPGSWPHLHRALGHAGLNTASASLVTTPRIICKAKHGPALTGLPQPVVDLESGLLAELAAAHDLPFLSLRAITDAATDEIPEFLRHAINQQTSPGIRTALTWLAQDVTRVQELVRLWQRSRRAARSLSEALMILWPHLSGR
jgi:adenosylhomocysteine nucleosidase